MNKPAALNIIFEDDVILVCHKPAGLMVEPDRNNHPNLLQQVKQYLKQQTKQKEVYAQHLHRLDRVTSGLVLFTKQKEHLRFLSEQFAQRQVGKDYMALTGNCPKNTEGTLEHWHRKEKGKAVLVTEGTPYAELAKLDFSVKPHGQYYAWHIKLHTGKFHQIRVQLASLGCPIIGDELYGSNINYQPNAIALLAYQLQFTHPVSKQLVTFKAPTETLMSFQ